MLVACLKFSLLCIPCFVGPPAPVPTAGDPSLGAFMAAVRLLPAAHLLMRHNVINLVGADGRPMNFLDLDKFGTRLFVRQVYLELLQIVDSIIYDPHQARKRVAIIGNPGIGKSFFGLLLLLRAIHSRQTVVFLARIGKTHDICYLFTDVAGFDLALNDARVKDALKRRDTLYLVDGVAPGVVNARTVLVTSPDHNIFHEFTKSTATGWCHVMPVWTENELSALRLAVFPSVSENTMRDLYNQWGGIPRQILEFATENTQPSAYGGMSALDSAILSCSVQHLIDAVAEGNEERRLVSHRVVHLQCSPQYWLTGYCFASEYVKDRLLDKLMRAEENALAKFAVASHDIGEVGGLRGQVFEYMAHKRLLRGGMFEARRLTDFGPYKLSVSLQPSHRVYLQSEVDIPSRGTFPATPTYFQPQSRTFPSIDAISAQDKDGPVHLFQMAVGTHPVKYEGLLTVLQKVGTASGLYFVMPRDRFAAFGVQSYLNSDNTVRIRWDNVVQSLPQYALCVDLTAEGSAVAHASAVAQAAPGTAPPVTPTATQFVPIAAATPTGTAPGVTTTPAATQVAAARAPRGSKRVPPAAGPKRGPPVGITDREARAHKRNKSSVPAGRPGAASEAEHEHDGPRSGPPSPAPVDRPTARNPTPAAVARRLKGIAKDFIEDDEDEDEDAALQRKGHS
eukprot:m.169108 g.169108  ORF g.169108 m.169108 type:complete len:679 (+) comp9915_c1_seq20:269-2305(+)